MLTLTASESISTPQPNPATAKNTQDRQETTCCVVGGGPAGAVLALLLARKGISVTLLEAHRDFDRDFRGDTLHPSILEIMDQIGLADRLLELRHSKIVRLGFQTASGPLMVADFSRLPSRFPYITLIPQVHFLEFISAEAARYPHFKLILGAHVEELIQTNGAVQGVRYRSHDGLHEIQAAITVGADGRFSEVRRLIGQEPIRTSPPMDVLWFRLSHGSRDGSDADTLFRAGHGTLLVTIDRGEYWQLGYIIPKGSYGKLRAAGIDDLQGAVAALAPDLADRVSELQDWKQVAVLSVESSRIRKWSAPGLLLIGDAAHVMSPVFGVGINYAIQDAVTAANLLTEPLKAGRVEEATLAAVQRQREWPTRIIQLLQAIVQQRVVAAALASDGPLQVPPAVRLLLQIPFLRDLPARIVGFGVTRVRLKDAGPV